MKIVTSAEMREIDRVTTQRFGVPSLTLMENAGSAVAQFALMSFPSAMTFGVVCGKGNNGGDGFVAARKLAEGGKSVRVLLLGNLKELRGDAAENFRSLKSLIPSFRKKREKAVATSGKSKFPSSRKGQGKDGTPALVKIVEGWESRESDIAFSCDVLIDAILGTGFRPPVNGVYAEAIARMNAAGKPVIAVDIPSGAASDVMGEQAGAMARADAIVTFTGPRPAHIFGNLTSGPIIVAPIGSPEEAIQSSLHLNLITPKDFSGLLETRPRDSNKGMYGHVLVIGGSVGKAGAAAMAGFSALRAGAGLVTVATAKSVLPTVAGFHPELMTEPLEETEEGSIAANALSRIEQLAAKKTLLAIGPGISRNDETAEIIRKLVSGSKIPIVLDADGLNAFEGRSGELNGVGRTLVLTPHPGEMARLTGMSTAAVQRNRVNVAREFAKQHKVILVLKGDRTIIADHDGQVWVNPTGNPGMATGGTGDILTGITAGMIAQFPEETLIAVIAAVYLHGLAGDVACASGPFKFGIGEKSLVATDLVRALPQAFHNARSKAKKEWAEI